jgi:capsular exopolysaccharide synthesis family protein
MSKIFDGLQKSEGAIAKLTIDVLAESAVPVPVAAEKEAAHTAAGVEEQALHGGVASITQAAKGHVDPEFPFEDFAEEFRKFAAPPASQFSQVGEAPASKTMEPDAPARTQVDPVVQTGSLDAAYEPISTSWMRTTTNDSGTSRSIMIRLRAGWPLLPFETGEADTAAEEYRRIRTKILQHALRPQLMLVSSPAPGDGKSITALNVAGALALNRDARVLLIDMDLRRPTIASLLGVPEQTGAADVLAGACGLEDAIVRLEPFPNLFLLPAGSDRSNPAELLSSPRWKAMCDELRTQMTYIVLDGPPVDAVAEYSLLEEHSDGLVLVVRTDHTVRSLLYGALDSIRKEKLVGTVVNGYRESLFWKQRGDYYY